MWAHRLPGEKWRASGGRFRLGGSINVPSELWRRAARERNFAKRPFFPRSTQGRHFVRIFVIDRVFITADVLNLGVSGFDCQERLGQRFEIAGILEPTVPYALVRSAQPPELGLVGFGNAVDVGGDLITWVRRIGASRRG